MSQRYWQIGGRARVVVLAAALGCGAVAGEEESAVLGVSAQALKDPDDPDGPLEWEGWEAMSEPSVTMAWASPALTSCGGHCLVAFQKSQDNQYWGFASLNPQEGTWIRYDTRTFQSSPAVVRFQATDDGGWHILVVGRGAGSSASNRRHYWSTASVGPVGSGAAVDPPVRLTSFATINGNSFSGAYGFPALAARTNGDVLMAYIDGTNVYVNFKPYISDIEENNWVPRVLAPSLPTGWQPVETPAVTAGYRFGAAHWYTLVVRAKSSGQDDRFYRIFFDGATWRDPFGTAQWKRVFPFSGSMPVINSSPALEYSPTLLTHTLYYRSGDNFYQGSFITQQLEEVPKHMIGMTQNPALTSAPSANGGVPFEAGEHWAIGRDKSTRRLHFVQSLIEAELDP
jgi:hypothetical protein